MQSVIKINLILISILKSINNNKGRALKGTRTMNAFPFASALFLTLEALLALNISSVDLWVDLQTSEGQKLLLHRVKEAH